MSSKTESTEDTEQEKVVNAKQSALRLAIKQANAEVIEFNALALVDLQGIYLRLHEMLSGIDFPIESGAIIGRLGALQINDVFMEIQRVVKQKLGNRVGILQDLYDQVKIQIVDGRPYLTEGLRVLKDGKYLYVRPAFEVFYANPPLESIEWPLGQEARNGSRQAREQLELLRAGKIRLPNYERDYRFFHEFIEVIKGHANCKGFGEGFFSWNVGPKGLKYWDEKEVDVRIAIRAMAALYEKHADVLCVISSDQDFIPLKEKCERFGVEFFQKDAAKFFSGPYIGKEIEKLGGNFIRGTFKPEWPLEVLSDFMDPGEGQGCLLEGITRNEALALTSLHNAINDYKINAVDRTDGRLEITLALPTRSDVDSRIDRKTNMKQVRITTLKW